MFDVIYLGMIVRLGSVHRAGVIDVEENGEGRFTHMDRGSLESESTKPGGTGVFERGGFEFHPNLTRVEGYRIGPGEMGRMPLNICIERSGRKRRTRGGDARFVRMVEGVFRKLYHVLIRVVTVDMSIARVVHGYRWVGRLRRLGTGQWVQSQGMTVRMSEESVNQFSEIVMRKHIYLYSSRSRVE